jgi:hypothetical protein
MFSGNKARIKNGTAMDSLKFQALVNNTAFLPQHSINDLIHYVNEGPLCQKE